MKSFFLLLTLCCTIGLFGQEIDREEARAELTKIVRAMEVYHPNAYAYADSSQIADLLNELTTTLPNHPRQVDLYRAANQLTCAFGDGHSRVWDHQNQRAYIAADGRYFPFDVTVKNNTLTIRRDLRGIEEDFTGAQINSINGLDATEVITRLREHASRETDQLDDALVSLNFPRYYWLAFGDFMASEVAERGDDIPAQSWIANVTLTDGRTLRIQGITAAELRSARGERTDTPVLTAKMLDDATAYLKIAHFEGRPKVYAQHFKQIFARFREAGATRLILDLRNHGGGDSRVGDELARYLADAPFRQFAYSEWKATPAFKENFKDSYLPGVIHWAVPFLKGLNPHTKAIYGAEDHANARVEYPLIKPYGPNRSFRGEVIMLMNNHTFSAGTCFAALFKDYQLGTIIGQESGNLANFHADGLTRLALPLAGAQLQISNSYLVRPSGDETARPVQPDVLVSDEEDALEKALDYFTSRLSSVR